MELEGVGAQVMRLVLPDQLFASSMLRFGQKASLVSFCKLHQIKMLLELLLYHCCPNLGQTTRMLPQLCGPTLQPEHS